MRSPLGDHAGLKSATFRPGTVRRRNPDPSLRTVYSELALAVVPVNAIVPPSGDHAGSAAANPRAAETGARPDPSAFISMSRSPRMKARRAGVAAAAAGTKRSRTEHAVPALSAEV